MTTDYADPVSEATLKELGKRSRRAALISSVGLLIFIGSFIYSSVKLYGLEKTAKEKQEQINELDRTKEQLDAEIAQKKQQLEDIQPVIEKQNQMVKQEEPFLNALEPKASAAPVSGHIGSHGDLYEFSLWIDAPESARNKIRSVTYRFDDPTFRRKERTTTDASNNFQIHYPGWGCLEIVPIVITLNDGQSFTLYFNMCKALGPDWS